MSLGNNGNIPAPTITTTNNANASTFAGMAFYGAAATPLFFMDEIRVDNNLARRDAAKRFAWTCLCRHRRGGRVSRRQFRGWLKRFSDDECLPALHQFDLYGDLPSPEPARPCLPLSVRSPRNGHLLRAASNARTAAIGWMTNTVAISVLASPSVATSRCPRHRGNQFNRFVHGDVLRLGTELSMVSERQPADGWRPCCWFGHFHAGDSPATPADAFNTAQGYYCIITNTCGFSAISITNSLTLDAPVNIVWQGGNPNTNWDLATTANFTNSIGTAVVFNNG